MDLATLRTQVRELLSETIGNLPDSTLNDLIERGTQRIETDYSDDYGAKPRQMLARTSGTVASTGLALPADFLRARTVMIGDATYRYTALENMPTESASVDSTVNLIYYKNIPKLVNDADTNWLLDAASRVYVYATAVEYALWNKDYEDLTSYVDAYKDARDRTARANNPRSAGGFGRSTGFVRGYYSIDGDNMIFGAAQ